MWLDRLASPGVPPTPSSQPGSRPYSPLPARPSGGPSPYITSQRASQTPRGWTVSLVSSSSTTSFLGAAKKPNGPGLRHSASYREGPAPDEVLEKLLGAKKASVGINGDALHSISEADLELDFDLGDLSLRGLAAKGPSNPNPASAKRPQTDQDCECRPYLPVWHLNLSSG